MKAALAGAAEGLLLSPHKLNYSALARRLRDRFGTAEQQEQFRVELKYRRRQPNESLQELSQAIERLVLRAYPKVPPETRDVLATEAFIDSLDCQPLEDRVRERGPASFREALTSATKLEAIFQSRRLKRESLKGKYRRGSKADDSPISPQQPDRTKSGSTTPTKSNRNLHGKYSPKPDNGNGYRVSPRVNQVEKLRRELKDLKKSISNPSTPVKPRPWRTGSAPRQGQTSDIDDLRAQLNTAQQQIASLMSTPTKSSTPMPSNRPWPDDVSARCQSPGGSTLQYAAFQPNQAEPLYEQQRTWQARPRRRSGNGPSARYRPRPDVNSGQRSGSASQLLCYGCGQPGHFKRNCPASLQPVSMDWSNPSTPVHIRGTADDDKNVYLKAKIGKRTRHCLLDSGCETTVIPARYVRKGQLCKTDRLCTAANHTRIPILGTTELTAMIGNTPVKIAGLVSEHVHEIMLGIDWLRQYVSNWNFGKDEVTVKGQVHQLTCRRDATKWCRRVLLTEDIVIPPRTQSDVNAKAIYNGRSSCNTWGTEPREVQGGVVVARTLLPNEMENLPVRVCNVTDRPVRLRKDMLLSRLEPYQPVEGTTAAPPKCSQSTDQSIIQDMMDKVDPSVPGHIKDQLRQLLNKYSATLSKNELDLGSTGLVVHRIDTGDHPPIRQPMRRYPPVHHDEIDRQITAMLEQGVISPAQSPWAANVVLAKKKDGSLRCCIDYRQLNAITRRDAYPVPDTHSCFDALAGSKWFTVLDQRVGYHQIHVQEEDKDKTAFITRRGMFRFEKMPFGLTNAVASFQRLMDLLMSDLNLEICLTYLDDLILFSSTLEEHLERLEKVLKRLQDANLKLKPSKCFIMQTKVHFLGHEISEAGVATDSQKVQLVKDWPAPTTLKQLRGFLGLTGYYRRFVQDYSKIALPLNKLLRKNRKFIWTTQCQQAFDQLKEKLITSPILALPRDEGTMILDTDASAGSIGCVLSQIQDGHERVIAYAGRALNSNELNYCVTRKELLAVVYFTKYFRQYLLGREFLIRTDHAALSWLKRLRDPIGQNARWIEQLEEFSYSIQHRAGTKHSNADSISRHPCLNKPSCTACHSDKAVECRAITSTTEQGPKLAPRGPADCTSESATDSSDSDPDDQPDPVPVSNSIDNFIADGSLQAAQEKDPDIGKVIALLKVSSTQPPWKDVELQSATVKSLWHEYERLSLRDGILCRKWTTLHGPIRWQIVLPEVYRSEFIHQVHSGMTGGHLGRAKTEDQLRQRAYWPGWKERVKLELKTCQNCAQYHRGKEPHQTPLQPFNAGEPFEIISIDVTGRHPTSRRGNEYIVTVMCLFSKWAEAYPVRNHTAPTIAKVLANNWFSRFSLPRRILSDRGREFESQLFQELCRCLGIEKLRTTVFKASTNGAVERFHRTLNAMIGKVVDQDQRDWDEYLPSVMAAYRASKHSATQSSPNQLVFGKENRSPIDIVLGPVVDEPQNYDSYDEYVLDLQKRLRVSHQIAREHLEVAAGRRKQEYDVKVKATTFKVGEWVWYFYPRRYTKKSPKWQRNYVGPYLVTKVIEPCDYVIQKTKKSAPQVVHGDKLARYYGEPPKSWLPDSSADQPSLAGSGNLPTNAVPEPTEEPVAPAGTMTFWSSNQRRTPKRHHYTDEFDFEPRQKAVRQRRLPARYADFSM